MIILAKQINKFITKEKEMLSEKTLKNISDKAKISINNIDVLYTVMPKLKEPKQGDTYETHVSVSSLCEFWNSQLPPEYKAQGFNVYYYNPFKGSFISGDPEELVISDKDLEEMADSMLFINDKHIKIAFIFFKGREHYKRDKGYVSVIQADGDTLLTQQELEGHPLDQSYYSLKGLENLLNEMCSIDNMSEGVDDWDFARLF